MVASDVYPVESAYIKKACLEITKPAPALPSYSTLTIQHPGEVGQEAEAMKGAAKLMLLCLRGTVDIDSSTVTNVAFAAPAPGMQLVLDSPRSGRAVALSDLFRMTFSLIRDHDGHDVRCREMSLTHISKAMASHLLLGNLTTNGITYAHNEANAVDPSAFLPQRNLSLVIEQQRKDNNARSELGMDVQDSHKTKVSTGIARIGAITDMKDITSLCINICAVISAITSDTAPEPIILTILRAIYKITLERDWDEWIVACGTQMPHLHLHIYSFIDRIWALLATGATEYSNTNVVTAKKTRRRPEPYTPREGSQSPESARRPDHPTPIPGNSHPGAGVDYIKVLPLRGDLPPIPCTTQPNSRKADGDREPSRRETQQCDIHTRGGTHQTRFAGQH
jgi:hypothetical protein